MFINHCSTFKKIYFIPSFLAVPPFLLPSYPLSLLPSLPPSLFISFRPFLLLSFPLSTTATSIPPHHCPAGKSEISGRGLQATVAAGGERLWQRSGLHPPRQAGQRRTPHCCWIWMTEPQPSTATCLRIPVRVSLQAVAELQGGAALLAQCAATDQ